MSWYLGDGNVCYTYDGANNSFIQESVMNVGGYYILDITVSNMTKGKIVIQSFDTFPEILENGTYQLTGKAIYEDLMINPNLYLGSEFDGCIDGIELRYIHPYSIYNSLGVEVFELTDATGVTADSGYIQYQIDWSTLDEGSYYIQIVDGILTYRSDFFNVKLNHSCTFQLTWNCNEDAFEFNYSGLSFTQSMRVEAKLWKPRYKALDKEVYENSIGDLEITYVTKSKEKVFTVSEIPEYMHDAFHLALDSDNFFIDGIKYVFPDEEVSPVWRNSSDLAPVEVVLRQSQNLRNVNCG